MSIWRAYIEDRVVSYLDDINGSVVINIMIIIELSFTHLTFSSTYGMLSHEFRKL